MASVTINTTAGEDARLAPAFGALLHLGGNATTAQVKAWLVQQMQNVVAQYEYQQQQAAIVQNTPIAPT